MNYIDTLLLRQEQWFLRLLGGGEEEQPTAFAESFAAGKTAEAESLAVRENFGIEEDETETLARRSRELRLRAAAAMERGFFPEAGETRARSADGQVAETSGAAWGAETGFLPGTGMAAVSARALSRTFERDARRYDGGYLLY